MEAIARRLARRRRWQALDRAKRRLAKVCRDCGNPAPTNVLCVTCYEKQYQRRPWLLALLNGRNAELQHRLHPGSIDRRRNGAGAYQMAWVLHPALSEVSDGEDSETGTDVYPRGSDGDA
jgi:hypothetical protein